MFRRARRDAEVARQLVLRAHLPGQADVVARVALRLGPGPRQVRREHERRLIAFVEGVGADLLVAPVAVRGPEPQRVLLDRAAERAAGVVDLQDAVGGDDALRSQGIVDVAALQRVVREVDEGRAAEAVAAILRDDVDAHAAPGHFGGDRAELVAQLLRRGVVGRQAGARVVARHVGVHDPIELYQPVVERAAVRLQLILVLAGRAADVALVAADADGHHADGGPVLRRRHRVDRVLADNLPLQHVLGVDDGAGAGHGYRFLERPDAQLGVDRRGEGGRQLDPFALDRRESG